MRFESLLERQEAWGDHARRRRRSCWGCSERTFRRWRDRYREEGEAGLADRRLGRPSPRRAPEEEIERMLGLFRDKYSDFTVKHFHEQLVKRHDYKLGYTVTKLHLHRAGLVRPAAKRSAHRKKRPRRPMVGMLLHQDGSRHAWLEGQPPLDLIVTMDDATSEVYSVFLVEEEGTASTFRGLARGGGASWPVLRALHRSRQPLLPHAGGRREGVEDAADAGRPGLGAARHRAHRGLFAGGARPLGAGVPHAAGPAAEGAAAGRDQRPSRRRTRGWPRPTWPSTMGVCDRGRAGGHGFVADRQGAWREILCIVEERMVGNDNTVAWDGRRLQLPQSRLRPHFVKAKVRVHAYPDGTVGVFLGPHRLARYTAGGVEIVELPTAPEHGPVLGAVKAKPWRAREVRGPDRPCARGLRRSAGRDGETGFKSNQETAPRQGLCGPPRDHHGPGSPARLPPDHPSTKKRTHHELRKPDKLTS